jgi:hypothetical protein
MRISIDLFLQRLPFTAFLWCDLLVVNHIVFCQSDDTNRLKESIIELINVLNQFKITIVSSVKVLATAEEANTFEANVVELVAEGSQLFFLLFCSLILDKVSSYRIECNRGGHLHNRSHKYSIKDSKEEYGGEYEASKVSEQHRQSIDISCVFVALVSHLH